VAALVGKRAASDKMSVPDGDQMPTEISVPRVFISYSHDDERHKGWVLALANRLVANGVDVILDRWDLNLGSDLARFMESGLTDADRVLAICTEPYVERANRGVGGVGYEKMILTAQIMVDLSQDKVIPVMRANPNGALPVFLGTRVYIDFRDDTSYEQRYSALIRELHGLRVIARPPLGANPFSDGATPILAHSRERYISPDLSGRVTFDYSNNDGFYTVGLGDLAFNTRWSRAGTSSIWVYRDGAQIASIALAIGMPSLAELKDVSVYDDSSRSRQAELEDVVIWRNGRGYYLATKVEAISMRYRNEWRDEVTFSYLIQPNRTPLFSF
jgi:TIR domain